jgi:hypothetical protein
MNDLTGRHGAAGQRVGSDLQTRRSQHAGELVGHRAGDDVKPEFISFAQHNVGTCRLTLSARGFRERSQHRVEIEGRTACTGCVMSLLFDAIDFDGTEAGVFASNICL